MNEKEISEIRRRLRPDKSNITHVYGCYVNEKREVISLFDQPLALATQEESESYLTLFKRALSGNPGKNLVDIEYTTRQVADGEEHKLLMTLRNSSLKDENAIRAFYQRVISNLALEGNYLILLAQDTYDVPYRSKDGEKQNDASSEVFSYILCCICPVKMTKPALGYDLSENEFHSRRADWVVSSPELGFLFPAFTNRGTDLYHALYYSRDLAENHREFVDAVFKTELPMAAAVQKETFQTLLSDTLAEECSYDVVQAVHEQLCERIEAHKANREEQPLLITKSEMREVLEANGVSDTRAAVFDEKFDAEFGAGEDLCPRNLVDNRQFEIRTPDVVIHVSPERSDLIETRVINGTKYILICAEEGVEVNGVAIHISDEH